MTKSKVQLTNGITRQQSSHAMPDAAEILEAGMLTDYASYLIRQALPAGVKSLEGLSGR